MQPSQPSLQAAARARPFSPWPRESWRASYAVPLRGPRSPHRRWVPWQVGCSPGTNHYSLRSTTEPLPNPNLYVQGVSKQQDDMAALSAQESKRAADIAKYVEQIPAAVVTEMLERVLNYTGEEDQRKVRMVRVGQQHLFSFRFNSRPLPWMRGSWFILVRKRCTTREPRATVHSGPPPAASSGLPCPTSTRPAMISDSGCRSCFRWLD